nr:MAG TPA: hypothetical protein [Caudoviricetes sp.]
MNEILLSMVDNLEKVGIGVLLFLMAYISNMALGAWRSVKIDGYVFDKKLILQSIVKFFVLGVGIALLAIVASLIPSYMIYTGVTIEEATVETIDNIIIIGAFLTATVRYWIDGISKLKEILGT